jgi:ATP-binding cassette, subfamily B, bacterial PglK
LCLIATLDLIGIVLIGGITSIAVRGIASNEPGDKVLIVEKFLHINNLSIQGQVVILALIACTFFVGKSLLSIKVSRRTLFMLGNQAAVITAETLKSLLESSLDIVHKESKPSIIYNLTLGINSIILGIVGTLVSLSADAFFLIAIGIGLFVLDPLMALVSLALFSLIGLGLYFLLHRRALAFGEQNSKLSMISNIKISDALTLAREIRVHDKVSIFSNQILTSRKNLSEVTAEISFLPNVSKYVLENAIVISALVVAGFQFLLKDASNAAGTLAIFLVAGTRLAPAVMRIQQGAIQIKSHNGTASNTLKLIEELREQEATCSCEKHTELGFHSQILIRNLFFRYINRSENALENINLEIKEGEFVALVGPSGAGKSTLLDVLLGLRSPSEGEVSISGKCPRHAIQKWPGQISFVPQNSGILSGSIAENIGLSHTLTIEDRNRILEVIKVAQLEEFVSTLDNGIDEVLSEGGQNLSGGQRQRIALARALFTSPKVLILDEATSALDSQTEVLISNAISKLKGHVTILVVAHRLSTVVAADKVVYMESGRILKMGTFDQVKRDVPNFSDQAELLGL